MESVVDGIGLPSAYQHFIRFEDFNEYLIGVTFLESLYKSASRYNLIGLLLPVIRQGLLLFSCIYK